MNAMRAVSWKMYPRPGAQSEALERLRLQCLAIYNAGLQVRRESWSRRRESTGYNAQTAELTALRNDPDLRAEWSEFPYTVQMDALKRLDLAFAAFFRRVKAGQTPGFPRFRGRDFFPGFGARSAGGWSFDARDDGKVGWLRVKGIPGRVRCRGGSGNKVLKVKAFAATRDRDDGWLLTTFCEVEVERAKPEGHKAIGIDLNCHNHGTADSDGGHELIPTPRPLAAQKERVVAIYREVSSKPKGSKARQKARRKLAKAKRREANIRRDFNHKLSAKIVREHSLIVTEELTISNMTRSAKGTEEKPGKQVAQKAGLNRSILDAAPAQFTSMLRYKAEEAGATFIEINTRQHAPSQTCPQCGVRKKKPLSERWHSCDSCGFEIHRDIAAAQVILAAAGGAPMKPAPVRRAPSGLLFDLAPI